MTPVPLLKPLRVPKASRVTTSATTDTTAGRTRSTVSATLGSGSDPGGVGRGWVTVGVGDIVSVAAGGEVGVEVPGGWVAPT